MNGETPLFRAYTYDGQFVEIRRVRLLHNGRQVVAVTTNRQTLELDSVRDAGLIMGMGYALLASSHREAA